MAKYKKLNVSEFAIFDSSRKDYAAGVFTLQLTSWSEFHRVVGIFNNNTDYYWRGQTNDELLLSGFDREPMYEIGKREEELSSALEALKTSLSELRKTGALTEDEVWARGQHYGHKTPLLDWTESPYVAGYFAFCHENGKQPNRVIYAVNRALKLLVGGGERFVEFDLPNSNFDRAQNERLASQKGKFTIAREGQDIEAVLRLFWRKTRNRNKYVDEVILAKILVPDASRDECLSNLAAMNITEATLFSDTADDIQKTILAPDG
jgi:hypothetical protein